VTAATSIRTRVRDEIIARLNAHQALVDADGQRVPVDAGDPGGRIQREHVWVAGITGRREVAFLEAGRKTIDDQFTIVFLFMATIPGADTLEVDDRVEVMGGALEDVLAEDPALSDAGGQPLDGLLWAVSARWDGPDHELVDEGAVSFLRADVECRARYE
jgi:hypothetical protein